MPPIKLGCFYLHKLCWKNRRVPIHLATNIAKIKFYWCTLAIFSYKGACKNDDSAIFIEFIVDNIKIHYKLS